MGELQAGAVPVHHACAELPSSAEAVSTEDRSVARSLKPGSVYASQVNWCRRWLPSSGSGVRGQRNRFVQVRPTCGHIRDGLWEGRTAGPVFVRWTPRRRR